MTATTRKPVGIFAVQVVALTLLIGMWPTLSSLYPTLFQLHADWVLGSVTGGAVEVFEPGMRSEGEADIVLRGRAADGAEAWTATFSARRIGWWPTAAYLALLLATPMTAGRRLRTGLVGVALLDVLMLARVGVMVGYAFAELEYGPGGAAQGIGHLLLRVGSESLTATIPSAVLVLLVWVWVVRPRQALDLRSLRRLLGLPGSRRAAGRSK